MRSEFKSATQIYVNPIHFEIQLILRNHLFLHTRTWWPKSVKSEKKCPKFFHRVIFAFWIQIQMCNPNLCKSHTFWNTANIEKSSFLHTRSWWPKFIGKSHTFWITANIEKWSFFAYSDLMTKIDEIRKISRNSFIG